MPAIYDFKRTLKVLLSQKEYLVYFTNMCSTATATPLVPFREYHLNLQLSGIFLPCGNKRWDLVPYLDHFFQATLWNT